ncbi:MAG TPA: AAA-like domain-containing protein [Candidatus Solibacter sp.]|nr:AAA-like domain-containing protein [Candidatus Solibacter sp.]
MSDNGQPGFYVAGGTLRSDALSYVDRQADRELYQGLMEGQFCYVLTARQMGKSSLMIRTVARLRKAGIGVAVLDLTALGQNLSAEQWYGGLLLQLGQRLNLEDELFAFWQAHLSLGMLQRWMSAVREVILPLYPGKIVIFVDEIDVVRSLPFSVDEFFAGIRECYNARSEHQEMERLSFSLLGVAAPTDLVRDTRMTPFNIGRRIELRDFTEAEAAPLANGLGREPDRGAALLQRVLYWTGGHPYLTQRLCLAVAGDASTSDSADVDRLCNELFLSPRAHERDDNLLFVRQRMTHSEVDVASLLDLYRQVHDGKRVSDDEFDPLVTTLRLSGITLTEDAKLKVRNRIYTRVFNREWIGASMPQAELRRQRAAYRRGLWRATLIASMVLVLVGGLAIMAFRQRQRAIHEAENNRRLLYDTQIRLAQEELDKADIGQVDELLKETMPEPGQLDLRGFEWYQFWREAHSDIMRLHEKYPVISVTLSSDGNLLTIAELLGARDKTDSLLLKLYDRTLQREMRSFTLPLDTGFNLVAFSPDRQSVVVADPYSENTGGPPTATRWDLRDRSKLAVFKGHTDRLRAMALSADGQLATADMQGIVKLWDANTGKLKLTLEKQPRSVISMAFSPDGKRLALADESQRATLWDTRTGRNTSSIWSRDVAISGVAFFPDGKRLLAAATDGSLQFWDTITRQKLRTLTGHSGYTQSMAFSANGSTLATGNYDRTVRLWSVATGQELRTFKGHISAVNSIIWSPDGKYLITGGAGGNVKVWDVATRQEPILPVEAVSKYLATGFSSKNELLALGVTEKNQVKLWNLSTGQEISTLDTPDTSLPLCAVFSPDKTLLATGGEDNLVHLWEAATGREIRSLKGHTSYVYAISFSPEGDLLVSGGKDKTLRLREVKTGKEIAQLKGDVENAWRAIFSPDGKFLASASLDGSVNLWDASARLILRIFKGHTASVKAIAFSPDGRSLATGGDDNTVRLWDIVTGQELKKLGLADQVLRAAFSPDGKRLVTGSIDGTVKLWDMITHQELMRLEGYRNEVSSITFSSDGTSLVTSGQDGNIRLRRTATAQEALAGH